MEIGEIIKVGCRIVPGACATSISRQAKAICNCVVHLPWHTGSIELLEDSIHSQGRDVIIAARIECQALSRASRKGCDAIGSALARYWREPPIRQCKLRGHVVVVVEK